MVRVQPGTGPAYGAVLICAAAALLAGCSTSGSAGSAAAEGSSTQEPSGDGADDGESTFSIGHSVTSQTDPYRVVLAQQVERFGAEAGLDLRTPVDANNDPAKQITDIQTLISGGVDGIVMVVLDSAAIKPALDRAADAGVPIVVIDQAPDAGEVAMIVRGDTVLMGRQACEQMGEQMGGSGKILELLGDLDGIVARERTQGFNDCMEELYPDIEVIQRPTYWQQEEATNAARAVLSSDPDVDGIFLASDSAMLPGVVTVLERLDRLHPAGHPDHVVMATIDGSPFSHEQVRAGIVDAVIAQPLPGYAEAAVRYLRAVLDGQTFEPGPAEDGNRIEEMGENLSVVLPTTVVTSENVDDPDLWGNLAD
jgi:ribose transport system substrate-binding protein